MKSRRSLLSRISPVMLILETVIFIVVVAFLERWEEFAAVGVLCVVLSLLGRTSVKFWVRYLKITLPLVLISVFFNWIIFLPSGFKTLLNPGVFVQPENLEALWQAVKIGLRFGLALYFSLFLVHVCSHEELVWGLAKLSERFFRKPVIGEILALALLSVPFFLESLAKVRRWSKLPEAVAEVFREAQTIVSYPVEIKDKKPGWMLLAVSAAFLTMAVILK